MDAYLIDAVRTPFGRHRGGLAGIRTDDLAALPPAGRPAALRTGRPPYRPSPPRVPASAGYRDGGAR